MNAKPLLTAIAATVLIASCANARPIDAPGASETETTIATLRGSTAIRAYRDVQAWTQYEPGDRRWHVVMRNGGRTSMPATIPASRDAPQFDVGPGPDGAPALVYSDCRRRCRVVIADLDGRHPRALPGSADASSPTIWGARVAWVRAGTQVITRRADRLETLAGAPQRVCGRYVPTRSHCELIKDGTVSALELHGSQLALIVHYRASASSEGGTTEVRLERVDGGRPRSIAEMNIGESGQRWLGPAWANGKLFFYRSCFCGRSEGAYRYDPGTRRYAHAPQRLYAGGFAIDDDGRRAFLNAGCNCDDIDALELDNAIRLSAPLHFRPWRSLTPA